MPYTCGLEEDLDDAARLEQGQQPPDGARAGAEPLLAAEVVADGDRVDRRRAPPVPDALDERDGDDAENLVPSDEGLDFPEVRGALLEEQAPRRVALGAVRPLLRRWFEKFNTVVGGVYLGEHVV